MRLVMENIMEFVEQVAEKLGGSERIKSMKTLQQIGYGQYAYMWGGGNISASTICSFHLLLSLDMLSFPTI